jgi:glycine C-acetyltransferase
VDDSHGVAAFGETGRGTEEFTLSKADVLVGTLGKGFGVNGGYVVGPRWMVDYLREVAPMYVYSNPITPPEAAAANASLELVQGPEGQHRIAHLRQMTQRFRQGLKERGLETLEGAHPIVPLMVRDNARTATLVRFLRENGILATAIRYPVVPKGDESIRFQVAADHTEVDIGQVLQALESFKG